MRDSLQTSQVQVRESSDTLRYENPKTGDVVDRNESNTTVPTTNATLQKSVTENERMQRELCARLFKKKKGRVHH